MLAKSEAFESESLLLLLLFSLVNTLFPRAIGFLLLGSVMVIFFLPFDPTVCFWSILPPTIVVIPVVGFVIFTPPVDPWVEVDSDGAICTGVPRVLLPEAALANEGPAVGLGPWLPVASGNDGIPVCNAGAETPAVTAEETAGFVIDAYDNEPGLPGDCFPTLPLLWWPLFDGGLWTAAAKGCCCPAGDGAEVVFEASWLYSHPLSCILQ